MDFIEDRFLRSIFTINLSLFAISLFLIFDSGGNETSDIAYQIIILFVSWFVMSVAGFIGIVYLLFAKLKRVDSDNDYFAALISFFMPIAIWLLPAFIN